MGGRATTWAPSGVTWGETGGPYVLPSQSEQGKGATHCTISPAPKGLFEECTAVCPTSSDDQSQCQAVIKS